jgi:hypothetical protein
MAQRIDLPRLWFWIGAVVLCLTVMGFILVLAFRGFWP